ncbi:MAG: terpene cyclase/mutase family protein, partial [bacterium]|nr:terpene cyclase/mutase family protein [bacterium]
MKRRRFGTHLLLLAPLAVLLAGTIARADEDAEARRERLKKAQTEFEESEAAFVESVNEAIDRGRDWLKKQQRTNGHWVTWKANTLDKVYPGRAALIMLTLAKCGVKLKDKDKTLERGVTALEGYRAYLASKAPGTTAEGPHTYSTALLVMMYEAIYARHPKPKPGARGADGKYGKGKRRKPKKNACRYPKKVRAEIVRLVESLTATQHTNVWRYPGPDNEPEDLSNAQYALLALQAAGRCGIEVPPEVYRRALEYLLEYQQKRGPEVRIYQDNPAWSPGEDRYPRVIPIGKAHARGWGYVKRNKATGSMTTAGIASLAIVKERLMEMGILAKEERKQIDAALRDGVGWFSKHFSVEGNPENASWHYYYLYGLERAGDLLGRRYMGEHDWYREGAEYLLAKQQAKGAWPGQGAADPHAFGETELIRTCFALLFLKRAT